MAPRKATTDSAPAMEPTRRSSRIAEKPKPIVEKKPAAKPRAKAAAGASKKREAEENAENDDEDGVNTKRQNKKAKPDTPPKEEPSENGEEQDELADDKDDDVPEAPKPIGLGDSLPSITLKNEKDEDVDVAQLATEKGVVFFLIPKADTPGCTQQACGFRDIYKDFEEFNVDVYCVSADTPSAISKWQSKKSLPYSLLSDRERKLISILGAAENNKTKRSHFIFEKGGKLVDRKIPVKPVDSPKLALEFIKQNIKKEA
ncbi:hypothetical protein Clacol_007068 [Clathrus columnatus]|uniref:thioredoxin-dependent peroxiredoxin n=1 Tax=Clathrus columnatus TaxID=1419009 RepID=A0AAV5AJG6_9AGAM|nr:hypothetical protein Clacol_007068 [Clathrus columnatus]